MQIEETTYQGWAGCYRLTNGSIELIITGSFGPRIIRFGLAGSHNEFVELDETLGRVGTDEWHLYGGHRFWHAPEHSVRTYQPDNQPVQVEPYADYIQIVQAVETATGIQKEIDIYPHPDAAQVTIVHRLRNRNLWAVELAPWALSVMAPGGRAITPLPPRAGHSPDRLLPTNTLSMWSYTDMSDPRWTWGRQHIMLEQTAAAPQKIGVLNSEGWLAHARDGHLFVKTFTYQPGATYPDMGCSVQLFTNSVMLELETLGPLVRLAPGAYVEHVERWYLFDGVPTPQTEADIEAHVLPAVRQALDGA